MRRPMWCVTVSTVTLVATILVMHITSRALSGTICEANGLPKQLANKSTVTVLFYPGQPSPAGRDQVSNCSAQPDAFLRMLCRTEASSVFHSPLMVPLVVAKDVSLVRYYAQRDLQGWTLAYQNLSFEVIEKSYRTGVTLADLSVFLCLGIQGQDKHCLRSSSYQTLYQGQRVNQIHGLRDILWRKDSLCYIVREALVSYHGRKNFTFPCWILPRDKVALRDVMNHDRLNNWIVKPSAKGEGHGIFVVKTFDELNITQTYGYVVQPLLRDPYLINGKKFDFRTYVLVTSVQPLQAYIYKEGLVRFASSKYDQNATRGGNETQFLTNTSIGKKYSHISNLTWTFKKLKNYFTGIGVNTDRVFDDLNDAIVRTLLVSEYRFKRNIHMALGGYDCQHCFQLLGVDVILDSHLKPTVIEVNGLPSMQLSHELGVPHDPSNPYTATKLELMHDVLQLLYTPSSVSESVSRYLGLLKVGVQPGAWCNPEQHLLCIEHKDLFKLLNSRREFINRGGFQRIYPSPNGDRYSSLIFHMHKVIRQRLNGSTITVQTLWQLHHLHTSFEKLYHISL